MFGQSSFGGFGQSQPASSPFGLSTTASPFGGTPAFGQQQARGHVQWGAGPVSSPRQIACHHAGQDQRPCSARLGAKCLICLHAQSNPFGAASASAFGAPQVRNVACIHGKVSMAKFAQLICCLHCTAREVAVEKYGPVGVVLITMILHNLRPGSPLFSRSCRARMPPVRAARGPPSLQCMQRRACILPGHVRLSYS